MAVPRNRSSNARKNTRRAHDTKKKKCINTCSNCSTPILSHRICPSCGYYKEREVRKTKDAEKKA